MVGVGRGRGPLLTLQVGSSRPLALPPALGLVLCLQLRRLPGHRHCHLCPPGNRAWMQHACGSGQGSAGSPGSFSALLVSVSGLIRYCFACVFAMFLFQKRCAQDNPSISLRDLAGLVLLRISGRPQHLSAGFSWPRPALNFLRES